MSTWKIYDYAVNEYYTYDTSTDEREDLLGMFPDAPPEVVNAVRQLADDIDAGEPNRSGAADYLALKLWREPVFAA